jgi:hypothetical protein
MAIASAVVKVYSSCGVPLHRRKHSHRLQSQDISYLAVGHVMLLAKLNASFHVQGLDLLIDSSSLDQFLLHSLLRRRSPTRLELLVQSFNVILERHTLFCENNVECLLSFPSEHCFRKIKLQSRFKLRCPYGVEGLRRDFTSSSWASENR